MTSLASRGLEVLAQEGHDAGVQTLGDQRVRNHVGEARQGQEVDLPAEAELSLVDQVRELVPLALQLSALPLHLGDALSQFVDAG